MNLNENNTPMWIVFLFDLFLSVFAITFAYLLRYNFQIPEQQSTFMLYGVLFVVGVRGISFLLTKLYAGIIRYTTIHDTERIMIVLTLGTIFITGINLFSVRITGSVFVIPFAVIFIELILSSTLLIISRVLAKGVYWRFVAPKSAIHKVIIYGIGKQSLAVKQTYQMEHDQNAQVVAFLDSNDRNCGKFLDGVEIHHYSEFDKLVNSFEVSILLISEHIEDEEIKSELIDKALIHEVKVLTVPKVADWLGSSIEAPAPRIRTLNIEDLLERSAIKLDDKNNMKLLADKCILVTGAAGSIGSEIVRQITRYNPSLVILLDQAESPLYDLELELKEEFGFMQLKVIIGDITHQNRMERLFQEYMPDVVYHAAAYKHVPMMEKHPSEAIVNNVYGTKILADLAAKYNVERFVMVSTDKAVNPTNVMGASKRIAEIYCQSLNPQVKTSYITTRFGNVLGSNGSVIPRFQKQIENGGPVTITHPDITRYFMTIPEACQLVLEAGSMGKGGEIFIFDMGKMVRINDLAKKMIRLAGLVPGKDIKISYTGLRPGEKLYEELLSSQESTIPTYNSRIMIAKVREYEYENVLNELDELFEIAKTENAMSIVAKMKGIVPEFVSNNSVFEKLDATLKLA